METTELASVVGREVRIELRERGLKGPVRGWLVAADPETNTLWLLSRNNTITAVLPDYVASVHPVEDDEGHGAPCPIDLSTDTELLRLARGLGTEAEVCVRVCLYALVFHAGTSARTDFFFPARPFLYASVCESALV